MRFVQGVDRSLRLRRCNSRGTLAVLPRPESSGEIGRRQREANEVKRAPRSEAGPNRRSIRSRPASSISSTELSVRAPPAPRQVEPRTVVSTNALEVGASLDPTIGSSRCCLSGDVTHLSHPGAGSGGGGGGAAQVAATTAKAANTANTRAPNFTVCSFPPVTLVGRRSERRYPVTRSSTASWEAQPPGDPHGPAGRADRQPPKTSWSSAGGGCSIWS